MTILFLLVLILYRLHYMTSTNAGLCQGNMSWCFEVRGPNYHWVAELYEQLNLPVLPAVVRALQKSVEERAATLKRSEKQLNTHMDMMRMVTWAMTILWRMQVRQQLERVLLR